MIEWHKLKFHRFPTTVIVICCVDCCKYAIEKNYKILLAMLRHSFVVAKSENVTRFFRIK